MVVYVLTLCDDPETLYGNTLVFKTIRVGFPTARIVVTDIGFYCGKEIREAAEGVGAEYRVGEKRGSAKDDHGLFIERLVQESDAPFVVCDPDVVFWSSMEDLTFPGGTLLAGRHIPRIFEMGATMAERLHPSLLFFPDPATLREEVEQARRGTPYLFPFRPYSYVVGATNQKVIFDTAASVFALLPTKLHSFGPEELDRYDHIFQGSMLKRAKEYGFSESSSKALAVWHDIAKGEDLSSLKGIWREQEKAFGGALATTGEYELGTPSRISWNHYVGFVYDKSGAEATVQVTTFWGDKAFRRHVALDYQGKRRVFFDSGGLNGAKGPWTDDIGSVEADGVRIHWDFLDATATTLHGENGKVIRYGAESFHASRPRTSARIHLTDHGVYNTFVGSVWYDSEQLPIESVRGWDWLAITFSDASDGELMIYAPAGEDPWGAEISPAGYRKLGKEDFRVRALDSYMSEDSGRVYGCRWMLEMPDARLRIEPVRREQEILDRQTGPYWEGACKVYDDVTGEQVGTAFFEAAGYVVPNEQTMGLRWALGDVAAAEMLALLARGSQVADDIVDGDVAPPDRGKSVVEMIDVSLRELPANPFFREHQAVLGPLISLSVFQWEASNEWHRSQNRTTRLFGFVLREALDSIIVAVALIKGGRDWAKKVLREVHTYYHVLDQETFEQWEAEHV